MFAYLHWQFVVGPRWLAVTLWNLELALLRFFSVGYMLRTLFAHWHRDAVAYTRRGFTDILIVFAWNQISRAVGFVVRSTVLLFWGVVQSIYACLALGFLLVFVAAPFLILALAGAGVWVLWVG